jgi:hypothetical protein
MDVKDIAALLDEYPEVKAHLKKMLDIIDGPKQGKFSKADDIEEQTIEAVRGLGQETIKSWAKQQSAQTSNQITQSVSSAKKNVKKKSIGKQPLVESK